MPCVHVEYVPYIIYNSRMTRSYGGTVSTANQRASIEDVIAAMAHVRSTLLGTELSLRRTLKEIDGGADFATAVMSAKPPSTRKDIADALANLERCRHEMRVLVFSAAIERGMSISKLGRLFEFSRQMAARYAKEARRLHKIAPIPPSEVRQTPPINTITSMSEAKRAEVQNSEPPSSSEPMCAAL